MRLITRAARVSSCKISDKKLQQNVHQLALAAILAAIRLTMYLLKL